MYSVPPSAFNRLITVPDCSGNVAEIDVSSGNKFATGFAATTRTATNLVILTAMPVIVARQATAFEVGMIAASYSFGVMLFAPVWGTVADITGRRRSILIGTAALSTLALVPLLATDDVWTMIALVFVYASFTAGFTPVILTIVSETGIAEKRGHYIGIFNSARAVGRTCGRLFAGVFLGLLTVVGLLATIVVGSVVATFATAMVTDSVDSTTRRPTVQELASETGRRLVPVGNFDHLRSNGLQWLYVAHAVRNLTVSGVLGLAPVYLLVEIGTTEYKMGLLLAFGAALQVFFMYVFGRVADVSGRKPVIALGMVGSGVFAIVFGLASFPASLQVREVIVMVGFVVRAVAVSGVYAGSYAFIGDVAPVSRESELMGLLDTTKNVGGFLGPPLLGAFATIFAFERVFIAASVFPIMASLFIVVHLIESMGPDPRPAQLPVEK